MYFCLSQLGSGAEVKPIILCRDVPDLQTVSPDGFILILRENVVLVVTSSKRTDDACSELAVDLDVPEDLCIGHRAVQDDGATRLNPDLLRPLSLDTSQKQGEDPPEQIHDQIQSGERDLGPGCSDQPCFSFQDDLNCMSQKTLSNRK